MQHPCRRLCRPPRSRLHRYFHILAKLSRCSLLFFFDPSPSIERVRAVCECARAYVLKDQVVPFLFRPVLSALPVVARLPSLLHLLRCACLYQAEDGRSGTGTLSIYIWFCLRGRDAWGRKRRGAMCLLYVPPSPPFCFSPSRSVCVCVPALCSPRLHRGITEAATCEGVCVS